MLRVLASLFALVAIVSANSCVPNPSSFTWQSPCSDQKFTNVINVLGLVAYQNGVTVDTNGGIDATQDLVVYANITDNYGKSVTTPLVDISLQDYTTSLGKCKWISVPTFGVLDNMDSCDLVDNCHFDNPPNPTTMTITVNIAQLAGKYVGILNADTYYGITITFKDGKDTDLLCVYVQDKLTKI